MRIIISKQLRIYATKDGKKPFSEWLEGLGDPTVVSRIEERLYRVTLGNFGDHRFIIDGVYELRLVFGAGYRIYYANVAGNIVLLLGGGDKSTQQKDIKLAIKYLQDYLSR